jgi:hypothetical protein
VEARSTQACQPRLVWRCYISSSDSSSCSIEKKKKNSKKKKCCRRRRGKKGTAENGNEGNRERRKWKPNKKMNIENRPEEKRVVKEKKKT